jgi:hypothetical protein
MRNADMPAIPSHGTMGEVNYEGMTKREAFAMAAMQGLLSNPYHARIDDDVMRDAVSAADMLLAALEAQP